MAKARRAPRQVAIGKGIAQAWGENASATVNYYELAQPKPVDEATLAAALTRLDEMPLDRVPEPAPLPQGSRMMLAHNPLFVGRQDDLVVLAMTLKGGATPAIGLTAAATGLGGIGKTQLAAEFAHRYGRFFAGGVFWLTFASAEAVPAEVAACGGAGAMDLRPDFSSLKQHDQMGLVLSKWQDGLPRLLVFDNCESPELLARWRQPSGACRVLVTSRRTRWERSLGVAVLRLGVLHRAQSVAMLRGFRPDLSADDPDLDEIAKELGDLPLALHLAGSYLDQYVDSPGMPAKLLAELRRPELLEHGALTGAGEPYSPTKHELSVARTFAISYDQLRPRKRNNTLARKALANAACLAPGEPIPRDMLLLTLKLKDTDRLQGEDALQRLGSLGLLETERDGALRLHRLLAAFVSRLDTSAQAVESVERVLETEANRRVNAGFPAALLGWQIHLRWVAHQAEKRNNARAGPLYAWLGRYLEMIGEYAQAREACEHALAIAAAVYGLDHPLVATCVNNLGTVLQELGDMAGARAAFELALTIDETVYGPDHPLVASCVSNLGVVLHNLGDLAGAQAALRRALTIDEAVYGPDHPKVAAGLNNLGSILQDMGDLVWARAAFERALRIDEVAFGRDHPLVATDVNNLGRVLQDLGDLAGARSAYERALKIDEAVYGPDHPSVAMRVNNLGGVLQDLGDLTGAKTAFERALRIDEAVFGPDHPLVAARVNNLGTVLQDLGDPVGAQTAYKRALMIDEAAYGPDHPTMATDFNNLASALRQVGDMAAARALYQRALKVAEVVYGPDHPTTKTVRQNLNALSDDSRADPKKT